MQGRDLYATIASRIYNNDYWDNMEKRQDGTPNPEGKKRRSTCKSLLLGIMYGRGAASIAEEFGSSIDEAQKIINDFYEGFPKVKQWVDKTESDAKINGYVEDLWGRRRRLPDIQLEKYTVKCKSTNTDFNPLLYTLGKCSSQDEQLIKKYKDKLKKISYRRDYQILKKQAEAEGVIIIDNGGFISQAQRQCVNSRVQGAAATMSKLAMRKVFDNQELKDLGFKILLQIHDELIGECPMENADKVADILTTVMKESAKPVVTVPFKCDATIEQSWYYTDYKDQLVQQYVKLLANNNKDEAFNQIYCDHTEFTKDELKNILYNKE